MTIHDNPLLGLAIILVAGVFAGNLAARFRLPSVTGQLLVGVLLGPSVLGVLDVDALHSLQPLTHFALGLIAVAVGNHLHIRRLRNAGRRLFWLLILEATLTPIIVFAALMAIPGVSWTLALLLAALAVSTAPATVVAMVKETRSKGVFVKTLIAAVALNNIACICLFESAHTAARVSLTPEAAPSLVEVLLAPFQELVFSAGLGFAVGALLILATRRVVRPDRLATASLIAILLTSGLADLLGISTLLSCLFLGVSLANLTPDKEEIGHAVFANFENAILSVFFTLAGMELDFGYAAIGGVLALIMVASRFAGKIVSTRWAMRLAGATVRVRRYLGPALIPQAGVAVGLLFVIKDDGTFSSIADLLLAVGITSVLINEIIGPVLTRWALVRSGDFGMDRARLMDFIHEENITTDLRAGTKPEAIAQLTDLLIRSHHLDIDRDEFLASVLAREELGSTSIGAGLAVPHGRLPNGSAMVGVMGVSRRGLPFGDTPDDLPLHCIVLLGTPEGEGERHLEVLGALSRAVADYNIRLQLYNARSPAHACEVLTAEELEDINYFYED